jgi:hypothetical protein
MANKSKSTAAGKNKRTLKQDTTTLDSVTRDAVDKNVPAPTQEHQRLAENGDLWRKWGPYLSERQWGTVREDYSPGGDAWDYFSHDQARSRAYKWGEDGLAGFSDDHSQLCFALALWNEKDPILKERAYGLTNSEGNHGEDVKEYYFYIDSTPTHSYMKYLYKYPHAAFPYENLWRTSKKRSRDEFEYELIDTGVFDDNRYFDVFVEFAKTSPEDTLIQITAHNRGPEAAPLHILPHLWFRNTWSWGDENAKPQLREIESSSNVRVIQSDHAGLGTRYLSVEGATELLFTENETNHERVFGQPNASPYVKDAFHAYIVNGNQEAVNPAQRGTKSAAHFITNVPAGESVRVRLRLSDVAPNPQNTAEFFGKAFDSLLAVRQREADEFYNALSPAALTADQKNVMRQALAGMLWSKQHYYFDLDQWLEEHGAHPLRTTGARNVRNAGWFHMVNDDVISMPDKWEYPWYAAWDLAFHTIAISIADLDFAKHQLNLMLDELYLHPNGQIPAYEWNFSDVNPPVHAWATYFIYSLEKQRTGQGDVAWLKSAFQKLLLNFTWWINRKDREGRNVFEGGFLGLDNIGVFDRSAPLPTGGFLEQADGTAWMALFCQNMLQLAVELSEHDEVYQDMASKFLEHFFSIAAAMDRIGEHQDEMWDEQDGFFYDLLRLPDGTGYRLKVRSMVGLLPLCAATVVSKEALVRNPKLIARVRRYLQLHPELTTMIASPYKDGVNGRRLLAILNEDKLRRVLSKMLDENEFLSPYGIRALSQYHRDHPYILNLGGQEFRVDYLPAESNTAMFGGNSNWRGPIWMPVNALLIRALLNLYVYYGDEFQVECPTGSGNQMTLFEVTQELIRRLSNIFVRDENGKRAVYGGTDKFQNDPYWRDYILFYEYFHGDNGAGLGASHQTGWTGVIARLIQMNGYMNAHDLLENGLIKAGKYLLQAQERE